MAWNKQGVSFSICTMYFKHFSLPFCIFFLAMYGTYNYRLHVLWLSPADCYYHLYILIFGFLSFDLCPSSVSNLNFITFSLNFWHRHFSSIGFSFTAVSLPYQYAMGRSQNVNFDFWSICVFTYFSKLFIHLHIKDNSQYRV